MNSLLRGVRTMRISPTVMRMEYHPLAKGGKGKQGPNPHRELVGDRGPAHHHHMVNVPAKLKSRPWRHRPVGEETIIRRISLQLTFVDLQGWSWRLANWKTRQDMHMVQKGKDSQRPGFDQPDKMRRGIIKNNAFVYTLHGRSYGYTAQFSSEQLKLADLKNGDYVYAMRKHPKPRQKPFNIHTWDHGVKPPHNQLRT